MDERFPTCIDCNISRKYLMGSTVRCVCLVGVRGGGSTRAKWVSHYVLVFGSWTNKIELSKGGIFY